MKISQLEKLAKELQKRPIPGKRVIIWIGAKEMLYSHIPKEMTKELALSHLPIDQKDVLTEKRLQKALRAELNKALQNCYSQLSAQGILIILDPELLPRYRIGLQPFYDYYVGDRTMTILIISDAKISIDTNLRSFFKLDEGSVLLYFKPFLAQNDYIVNALSADAADEEAT